MSGMFVINGYSSTIFNAAEINPKMGTLLVGIFNVIGAFVPMMLINKYGRKPLLYYSYGLMFICHSFIVISFKTDIDAVSAYLIIFSGSLS